GSAITRRGATIGSPNPIPRSSLTTSRRNEKNKPIILIFWNLYTSPGCGNQRSCPLLIVLSHLWACSIVREDRVQSDLIPDMRPMTIGLIQLRDKVLRNIASQGEAGTSWLGALPSLLGRLEAEWSVKAGGLFPNATEAFVSEAVTANGQPAVLKIPV